MKKILLFATAALLVVACAEKPKSTEQKFFKVVGQDILDPDGNKFFIKGTNLGNWLNPEGYMFHFSDVSSARLIDEMFCEMVGEEFVGDYWRKFRENYVTAEDIAYLKRTGMNSLRLPFHYKLFTEDYYMGSYCKEEGFRHIDSLIKWCRAENLPIILDMHVAPGGQTGDNIDDSYGYPWLMVDEGAQRKTAEIWKAIAQRYKDEPMIMGYDLLNEPIAHYFEEDLAMLNSKLEPLYKRIRDSIRTVDTDHIIFYGPAQWNGNLEVFSEPLEENCVYEVHRYWSETTQASIQSWLDFREKFNRPLYIGETGENTDEWVYEYRVLMEKNDIGWHYWPSKKHYHTSGIQSYPCPDNDVLSIY